MGDEAVIVATARTAVGTAFKGTLVDVDAFTLATEVVGAVVQRSGLDPERVDDVVLGESLYGGGDVARFAALQAGLERVPGAAVNRHCASSLASLQAACGSVRAGMDQLVVAGGVQSTSTSPRCTRRVPGTDEWSDWMSPTHPDSPEAPNLDMSITVGWNTAQRVGTDRAAMDAWALRSHRRAVAAIDAGAFVDEIVPITVTRRDGTSVCFDTDEHPRRDTDLDKLAALKPLHPEIEGFSITAGNACGTNDAAAAVVVASAAVAEAEGLTPMAIVRSWAAVGVPPVETGLAPVTAIPKALRRAGLGTADVDLFEVNEAFAAVPIAAVRLLDLDEERVNVLGSGCSLGHPVAATGTRMVVSMVHELRRRGGGVGVVAMCAGGGMGSAVVLEVPRQR
jgi:acetyl-CoA acetyltransferase family protein